MVFARRCVSESACRRARDRGRWLPHLVLALIAYLVACTCVARESGADPRFGDSAWVAPGVPTHGDSTVAGPRVAPRDHERRWETALRAPFRVAFLPLRLLARGLEP